MIRCSHVGNQKTCARLELVEMNAIECARGLLMRAKMCFGSLIVQAPLTLMDVEWWHLVAVGWKSELVMLAET